MRYVPNVAPIEALEIREVINLIENPEIYDVPWVEEAVSTGLVQYKDGSLMLHGPVGTRGTINVRDMLVKDVFDELKILSREHFDRQYIELETFIDQY
jgi:hypothetical protein